MGTNYYLHDNSEQCSSCGCGEEILHIGKSSCGWSFALHVIPERGINDYEDWDLLFDSHKIMDEYSRKVSAEEMRSVITEREPGLRRDTIDARHCIGHGSGTWDLITGEFC